jgi:hypothetical protein
MRDDDFRGDTTTVIAEWQSAVTGVAIRALRDLCFGIRS